MERKYICDMVINGDIRTFTLPSLRAVLETMGPGDDYDAIKRLSSGDAYTDRDGDLWRVE